MNLASCKLRPGQILEVLENGRVRVEAAGLFSAEDGQKLPIIEPFVMGGNSNSFSSPKIYDWVWVLNNEDNPQQLYWLKKEDSAEANKSFADDTDVEIICNREVPGGNASLSYGGNGGWNISTPSGSINITPEGYINLTAGDFSVEVNENGVNLGGKDHPAVYGDKLIEVLSKINETLNMIKTAAATNQFTKIIELAIGSSPDDVREMIPNITSDNVNLI